MTAKRITARRLLLFHFRRAGLGMVNGIFWAGTHLLASVMLVCIADQRPSSSVLIAVPRHWENRGPPDPMLATGGLQLLFSSAWGRAPRYPLPDHCFCPEGVKATDLTQMCCLLHLHRWPSHSNAYILPGLAMQATAFLFKYPHRFDSIVNITHKLSRVLLLRRFQL